MMRLGLPEMIIILCIALFIWGPRRTENSVKHLVKALEEIASLVWRPRLTGRLRFVAPTETFNKTFLVALTLIFALFGLAELWLLGPWH